MMKAEFEALAGYEVTDYDYDVIIEPMYMASPLSKEDFVKCINKKRFALEPLSRIEREMKIFARHLRSTCERYTDYEAKDLLEEKAKEYMNRIGAYGYIINTSYTLEFLGAGRGCTYPSSIEFYNKNYGTIKKIALV